MNYPIAQLSPSSRIWVYLSSRALNSNETDQLLNSTVEFLNTWSAHEKALKAGVELLYNQVLIIAVDENIAGASGCSIDKLQRFIKETEKSFQIDLLNRMLVAVKTESGLKTFSITELQDAIKTGKINGETIIINTLLESLKTFSTELEVPLHTTWLTRYLQPENA